MKYQLLKALFIIAICLAILAQFSCGVLPQDCGNDVVKGEYQCTPTAKSFLPNVISNTLIYTNGQEDIIIHTEDGLTSHNKTLLVNELCYMSSINSEAYEIAEVAGCRVQYIHEIGVWAFTIGIGFSYNKEHYYDSYESAQIFEYLYVFTNPDNMSELQNKSDLHFHVNDIQNEKNLSNSAPLIIEDTIINNIQYTHLYKNIEEDIFYSKEKGVIAFKYLDEFWYLKE